MRTTYSLAFLLVFAACTPKEQATDGGLDAVGDEAVASNPADTAPISQAVDGPPAPRSMLTAEILDAKIMTVGPPRVVPTAVVVEFAVPAVESPRPVRSGDRATVMKIEPPVEGKLAFVSPKTLSFTPTAGFRPASSYKVTLEAVRTKDGLLRPKEPWTFEFSTPAFGFVGLTPRKASYGAKQAEVEVFFSAPFRAEELARLAKWKVGDVPVEQPVYKAGGYPYSALVSLSGAGVAPEAPVHMEVAAGLRYGETLQTGADLGRGTVAPSTWGTVKLGEGPPVHILAVNRQEGPTGFYLRVICNDVAAGGMRYYWDDFADDSYRVSRRCLFNEAEAKKRIHIEPAINFSLSQSPDCPRR